MLKFFLMTERPPGKRRMESPSSPGPHLPLSFYVATPLTPTGGIAITLSPLTPSGGTARNKVFQPELLPSYRVWLSLRLLGSAFLVGDSEVFPKNRLLLAFRTCLVISLWLSKLQKPQPQVQKVPSIPLGEGELEQSKPS